LPYVGTRVNWWPTHTVRVNDERGDGTGSFEVFYSTQLTNEWS